MAGYDSKNRLKALFNGFLMGLGFGFILTGGQGFFYLGGIMILIGGTLERREQKGS